MYIPRFLTAMKPPLNIDTFLGAIHLVAQLPFANDTHTHHGAVDVWCNANEIWEIVAGDEEEHATLLFNYLYYLILKRNSSSTDDIFLCAGKAVPEGL